MSSEPPSAGAPRTTSGRKRDAAGRTARQMAFETISTGILAGDFPEGQFLDEVTLAEFVGTSRTPVREALRQLQAERFVDLVPHRGAQVRVITARELEQVYQTRRLIESEAIRIICAERLGAPQQMHELTGPLEAAEAEQDWLAFATADQAFHTALVRHQGNDVLSDLYASLRHRHIRLSHKTATEAPWRIPLIQHEHAELIASLDRHDAEAALSTLQDHLATVPELLRTLHANELSAGRSAAD